MTETVVHVTTIEEWKSVLDVWFKQGHKWRSEGDQGYHEGFYCDGSRQLGFNVRGLGDISYWSSNDYTGDNLITYTDFMAQQKEDNKMETYYVTQEQLDLIQELKSLPAPLVAIMDKKYGIDTLYNELPLSDKEWLRYLGGDETIEFKVKEQLYRLWRIDDEGKIVHMRFGAAGTPTYTSNKDSAFTAPLEEIKKWQTPAWDIEEVN